VTPPTATTPAAPAGTRFEAIGTDIEVLVTEPGALAEATAVVREHLDRLDLAVSRFRPDSEVSRLARAAEDGAAWALVSPVFASALRAALRAARLTAGSSTRRWAGPSPRAATTPTWTSSAAGPRPTPVTPSPPRAGARSRSTRSPTGSTCRRGCLLDLGATAKAHAADASPSGLSRQLPGGFLVNFGGDIAVAGEAPAEGWQVGVDDAHGSTLQVVAVTDGQGLATSSTRHRTWATADGGTRHHLLDPRTGRTATTTWHQVTCVGATALEANAASTAAVVLGEQAPAWLEANGIPARLDAPGRVVTSHGWPEPPDGSSR